MKKNLFLVTIGLILMVFGLAACKSTTSTTNAQVSASGLGGMPPSDMQTQIAANPDLATQMASRSPGGRDPSTMQTQIASNPAMATQMALSGGPGLPGSNPAQQTQATPTAAATEQAQPTETPEPTATPVSKTSEAEQAAQDYFAALEKGDFSTASKMVSAFSKTANSLTVGDISDLLAQQKEAGPGWSNLQINDSQVFDEHTILVHITYQMASKDAQTGEVTQTQVDELWPFRLENGKWLYNWSNMIDYKTLGVAYQKTAGLTIKPLQLTRYTDKVRLSVLAQNNTNETIVIGTANQVLATFNFGDQEVEAELTPYVFERLRSYMNVNIDVMGLFTTYPDSVEIMKYKNYQMDPWYTFDLQ